MVMKVCEKFHFELLHYNVTIEASSFHSDIELANIG